MPDALAALLKSKRSAFAPPDPDEQSFDDQYGALNDGYGPGGYAAANNAAEQTRNDNLARSGVKLTHVNDAKVSALSRMLGIPETAGSSEYDLESTAGEMMQQRLAELEAEAQAKALPTRISGEYGLRETEMQGQTARDVANISKQAAAEERAAGREFTAGQNERARGASMDRTMYGQEQQNARTTATQQGQAQRAQMADRYRRATALRKQAAGVGFVNNLFTGNRKKLNDEADALSQQGGGDEYDQIAAVLSERFPGMSLQQLIDAGKVNADSPEEIQALQEALARVQ